MSENTTTQVADETNEDVADVTEDEDEAEVVDNGQTYVTLYAAAGILTELRREAEGDDAKEVSPQSLYGPGRKGNLPGLKTFDDGKVRISLQGVKELWDREQAGGKPVSSRVDVKALAAEVAAL
jgi:hypothetical protein